MPCHFILNSKDTALVSRHYDFIITFPKTILTVSKSV